MEEYINLVGILGINASQTSLKQVGLNPSLVYMTPTRISLYWYKGCENCFRFHIYDT